MTNMLVILKITQIRDTRNSQPKWRMPRKYSLHGGHYTEVVAPKGCKRLCPEEELKMLLPEGIRLIPSSLPIIGLTLPVDWSEAHKISLRGLLYIFQSSNS